MAGRSPAISVFRAAVAATRGAIGGPARQAIVYQAFRAYLGISFLTAPDIRDMTGGGSGIFDSETTSGWKSR